MNKNNSKEIFKMSIPIFLELLLQLLVGNIDQIMISRYSQEAVAAIGNGNQIMNIIIIVLSAMSVSTTILISQYLGASDRNKSKSVTNVSVVIMAVFSIFMTLTLVLLKNHIFVWLKVPENIQKETSIYTIIVGSFTIVQAMYMVFSSVLRSYRKMKEIMFSAIIMNSINIIGNALLINGMFGFPRLGIIGAAISTNISKMIGLIIIIIFFLKKTDLDLSFLNINNFSKRTAKRMLLIALPSGGESLSYNLSQLCILKFINLFGTAIIATKVYCSMLSNAAYVYSSAIAQATQVVVGYLIGMGDYKSMTKRVWTSVFISMVISVSITTVFYFNSDFVFGIFTDNSEIIELGKQILLVEIFLEFGRSVNITMVRCLIAAGDVNFPLVMCLFSSWVFGVGGSWFFGINLNMGLVGIWIAMAIDECFRGFIFVIRFKLINWQKRLSK